MPKTQRQLTCPGCQALRVCAVVDSRTHEATEVTRRRYACRTCGQRFTRWESRINPAAIKVRRRTR